MSSSLTDTPFVSVVVPSWRGEVQRLCDSLARQSYRNYEVIVVRGVAPAGRARNEGVRQASGTMIAFIDDDAYLGHERVLETLVAVMQDDPTIGVVGPSKLIPPDASRFQRRVAREIPRWVYPVLTRDTESNPPLGRYGFTGITTTCCLVHRHIVAEAGGFDEHLTTGEDTELFYRIRRAGYRFVIPADCWVYHDPPRNLSTLLRKSFHYGLGHAAEARKHVEREMDIVPLQRWYGKLLVALSPFLFVPSLFIGVYFEPTRHVRLGFRPLKALSTYATLYGYTWGWLHGA